MRTRDEMSSSDIATSGIKLGNAYLPRVAAELMHIAGYGFLPDGEGLVCLELLLHEHFMLTLSLRWCE